MEFKKAIVEKVLPMESGVTKNGQPWQSQSVIVREDIPVQYPDRVRVKFGGDRVSMLENIHEGDAVRILWSAEVSEFQKEKDGQIVTFYSGYNYGFSIEKINKAN